MSRLGLKKINHGKAETIERTALKIILMHPSLYVSMEKLDCHPKMLMKKMIKGLMEDVKAAKELLK